MGEGRTNWGAMAGVSLAGVVVDNPRLREIARLRRRYAFVNADEAMAFVEAYYALDRYSTDTSSFYEIRTALIDGDIIPALGFFDDVAASAQRSLQPKARENAGEALRLKAQLLAAIDRRAAVELLGKATEIAPSAPRVWLSFGRCLSFVRDELGATPALQKAAKLARANDDWMTLREACWRLAAIARSQREYDRALFWSQQNLKVMHGYASEHSGDIGWTEVLAHSYADYGQLQAEANSLDAGRRFLEQAESLWLAIARREPANASAHRCLVAKAWRLAAGGCIDAEEGDEAHEAVMHAIGLIEPALSDAPADRLLQAELAHGFHMLAEVEQFRQNLGHAMTAARRAAALRGLLFGCETGGGHGMEDAAHADANVGRLHLQRGEYDSATAAFDRAISKWKAAAELQPPPSLDLYVHALTLTQRGSLADEGSEAFEEALDLMAQLAERGPLTGEQEDLFCFLEAALEMSPMSPANDA